MTLASGQRLGPYEILNPLGAGGMGEVYRAKDTRLDRTVAIKVLPAHVSQDPERRARFEREAKTVASLNHPHICVLHDVGHQDGVDFLVMEYLEGETLAERVAKGPLPIGQVLRYGTEIADALARAHREHIVHRDLKPANVLLTKTGAKLLDFGLAKAGAPLAPAPSTESHSPTATRGLTTEGTLLGTFQYMSPEQLEGKDADHRADIWALGCVLYEMATGKRAFEGKSQASLISAIMTSEPQAIAQLQPMTPPALDRVTKKCLAKDPDDRWDGAHDVADELRFIAEGRSQSSPTPASSGRVPSRERVAWVIAGAALLVAAIVTGRQALRGPERRTSVVTQLAPPAHTGFARVAGGMALSADGRQLALVALDEKDRTQLWMRSLATGESHALDGTDGAALPFWSPDGRSLGFFAGGKLKKLEIGGREAEDLADAAQPLGGSWGPDGTILFSPGARRPIMRISTAAGQASPATFVPEGEVANDSSPTFLPDGRHFLYVHYDSRGSGSAIVVGSLDSREVHDVLPSVTNAAYAAGRLLYLRAGDLRAQAFDAKALTLSGEAARVAEHVEFDSDLGRASFAVSERLLVYQAGDNAALSELVLVDRAGRELESLGAPALYYQPRLSHSGRQLAVDITDAQSAAGDLWLLDVARKVTTRLTHDPVNETNPLWSPDDRELFYYREPDIWRRPASGAGEGRAVLQSAEVKRPSDLSRDGRFLLFLSQGTSQLDIEVLSVADGRVSPWLTTPFDENGARFSPDGRWVAYASDETGRREVYVRGFDGGDRVLVSSAGGGAPVWRPDGRELYYLSLDDKLVAVPIRIGAHLETGPTRSLFELKTRSWLGHAQYDVMPDGQRFVVNRTLPERRGGPMTVVADWAARIGR